MIREFSFYNYKAFKEGKIEIKPLTILLGANSVGKSSISQLLLMLKQTASEMHEYDESSFRLNGQNVGLGENVNLLRNKDEQNILKFSFAFENYVKDNIVQSVTDMFFRNLDRLVIYTSKTNYFNLQEDFRRYRKNKSQFIAYINGLKKAMENNEISIWAKEFTPLLKQTEELIKAYDFITALNKVVHKKNKMEIHFEYRLIRNSEKKISNFVISRVLLTCDKTHIIDWYFNAVNGYREFSLFSDLYKPRTDFCDENYRIQLSRLFPDMPCNMFGLFSKSEVDIEYFCFDKTQDISIFLKILYLLLQRVLNELKDSFEDSMVNYVSPLRAYPKRYYFLDRGHVSSSLDTLDGDSITEILKDQKYIKELVNTWLRHFKLEIDVETVEEIIHKLKVNQNGLSLDITDVGFGISQLLPVIVQGFYTTMDSLTIIEQPEVHLHPRMQADLGDLFIDIVFPNIQNAEHRSTKNLLIETHSEYLLKRIRRRIATGRISSDDVAIYMVKTQDNPRCSTINRVNIDKFGDFDWPEEFYGGELLQDTLEFLKVQATKKR